MQIGWIGTGIMGSRMAARLIEAGHELQVYNRTRAGARSLEERGARFISNARAIAEANDLVFTMLADPAAVESVALGPQGLLSGAHENLLWVDSSTVDPAFSRRMAGAASERGLRFLDAPVAGSKKPAEEGQLLFLVGGDADLIERVEPLFSIMGKKTIPAGPNGAGSSLKMVINLMLGLSMASFSEAFRLGQELGLSEELLLNTLPATPVVAPFVGLLKERLAKNDYSVNFPLKHMQKDLRLALASVTTIADELPLASGARDRFGRALENGLGDLDFSALFAFDNARPTSSDL
ncbi:MAG: NAD(P)-dependent oxidoreductase [Spirochaetales bacterium]|nr:NAD(P)-dependent oxidoreductase [Leptospiraceae bacterium]MCP5481285.1 NAD(P)-dependent oxidoreductase [Spirochaetales bacterium]MCP5485721.1 NAD(P)-dependent oxidoreductase [Spirochaetales bacterium]